MTQDVVRSLTIGGALGGLKSILVIHHTDCGRFPLLVEFSIDQICQGIKFSAANLKCMVGAAGMTRNDDAFVNTVCLFAL